MARYRGFERDRRTVVGILEDIFGAENVFRSHAEFRAAEVERRRREAEAGRELRRQFEYELSVLTKVAADEGLAAASAVRSGDAAEARDCAYRAWHVARLVLRGAETGKRAWAFDVVGRCVVEAGVHPPAGFITRLEVCEMIERAEAQVRREEEHQALARGCPRRALHAVARDGVA